MKQFKFLITTLALVIAVTVSVNAQPGNEQGQANSATTTIQNDEYEWDVDGVYIICTPPSSQNWSADEWLNAAWDTNLIDGETLSYASAKEITLPSQCGQFTMKFVSGSSIYIVTTSMGDLKNQIVNITINNLTQIQ